MKVEDIEKLPIRVIALGSFVKGSLVECPTVPARQLHPDLHVLFVPDDPREAIEPWGRSEVLKYFSRDLSMLGYH